MTASEWIKELGLALHIEGGAFKEIYRTELLLPKDSLKPQHSSDRHAMTSIYFLLQHGEFSAFHRIASDEIWHHYDGAPLCIYEISAGGMMEKHLLGKSLAEGEKPGCNYQSRELVLQQGGN
jgi:predicted cupin superfamily sugar epimerase